MKPKYIVPECTIPSTIRPPSKSQQRADLAFNIFLIATTAFGVLSCTIMGIIMIMRGQ
ncbi:hypothetical protein SEA_PUREGLOBE5_15 [Arthrobacter phage Pureglobe5]|nr:hypothetical protein SEA_ODYSSEY395_15 [Arthrobacter phage Odyssey395]UYL87378.1 hypothetical protein SEA_PUREGLOBE5_15 [Arthrobacter phage Pureglobe5]